MLPSADARTRRRRDQPAVIARTNGLPAPGSPRSIAGPAEAVQLRRLALQFDDAAVVAQPGVALVGRLVAGVDAAAELRVDILPDDPAVALCRNRSGGGLRVHRGVRCRGGQRCRLEAG